MQPNEYNMQYPKHCAKNLTIFKLEPTTRNMLQHAVTGWPNVCSMLCPKMLQYVALKCCESLAGALETTPSCLGGSRVSFGRTEI